MVYLMLDGEHLRSLREQQWFTQRSLAEVASISRKTVMEIEGGKVHPRPSTVRKIAKALEVDPRSLATVASRA